MSTESTYMRGHMRRHTITTTTRRARSARRRVIALVLGVCALAIPATASGAPHIPHGADYSSLSATADPANARIVGNEGGQPSLPPTSEPAIASDSPSDSARRPNRLQALYATDPLRSRGAMSSTQHEFGRLPRFRHD